LEDRLQELLSESFYDPLWVNARATWEGNPWIPQQGAVDRFLRECATRTRSPENFGNFLAEPALGIAAAVRAVATWYRASMTDIYLQVRQQQLATGGYRLICEIENRNTVDALADIEVRLTQNTGGVWRAGIARYQGVIFPTARGGMFWDFPQGESFQGMVEVIGNHLRTPDLGYAKVEFRTNPMEHQEVDPTVLISWQGQWTLKGRDMIGPYAGQVSNMGVFEIWVDGTTARIKSTLGSNILPVTVVDNGRCIEIDWSNEMAFLKGTLCMGSDGNAYSGTMTGSYVQQNAPVQAECWGERVR
jgi:hypothetical protein